MGTPYKNQHQKLFLEPEVKQYGSHMVMTNVSRQSKHKYVSFDTKYCDEYSQKSATAYNEYGTNSVSSVNITMPERINDVKSMIVCNVEVPMSFHTISATLGNNYFKVVSGSNPAGSSFLMVNIPNGTYTAATLVSAITTAIHAISDYSGTPDKITLSITSGMTTISSTNGTYTIVFDVDPNGNPDASNFKNKLGWVLGFRGSHYTIRSSPAEAAHSECMVNLNTVKYLYLVLDEFTKGNQNSFVSPTANSLIRKNIIAKISINSVFGFGSVLPANNFNGYLLSDRRHYTGKVDLQRLNVQLVDDRGVPVDLNGLDFSFCIEVEHE